ncbi:MAG: penicillin-binding protein transpeptidase [Acidimicrobiaceae bacterium]|nr:penicillin-binding protein transpeptidase [Acidimicrobiaceae bacterium]
MDRRIRVLALFLLCCFVLLVAQLGNLQVRQAAALKSSPYEPTTHADPYTGQRGEILSADGFVLAKSVKQAGGGYQRVYPQGPLFADITGYVNQVNSNISTGLEDEYGNPFGTSAKSQYLLVHEYPAHGLRGLLNQRQGTDTITTTVTRKLQLVAQQALGSYSGALVALDPRNGNILAMYSNPSYDPTKLSSSDAKAVTAYFNSLNPNSGSSPLVNGVTYNRQAPGSTFKLVTTAAIFDRDPSLASTVWPPIPYTKLPNTTSLLHNYASEVCGGNLAQILEKSCDTAFGLIGLKLGPVNLAGEANAFGFNQQPPIDLPSGEVSASVFPPASSYSANDPFLAYSAIGQYNVQETPLEDALIAGAMGQGGTMMAPHLLSHVVDDQGTIVETYQPRVWLHATSSTTAGSVLNLMLGVAKTGTAAGVFPSSLNVAAKTGTAETGSNACSADWIVATAPAGPGQTPTVAVAGYLPFQAGLSCSETGAQAAGPRVAQLLEAALAQQAATK